MLSVKFLIPESWRVFNDWLVDHTKDKVTRRTRVNGLSFSSENNTNTRSIYLVRVRHDDPEWMSTTDQIERWRKLHDTQCEPAIELTLQWKSMTTHPRNKSRLTTEILIGNECTVQCRCTNVKAEEYFSALVNAIVEKCVPIEWQDPNNIIKIVDHATSERAESDLLSIPVSGQQNPTVQLTERELEVLKKIADGLIYKEIALKLHISRHTVTSHSKSIFAKLDVNSRQMAANRARELGIIPSAP